MSVITINIRAVNQYIQNAKNLAEDVTTPEKKFFEGNAYTPYYQTPYTYYSYNSYPFFGHSVHHYHHTENRSSKSSKENNALGAALALTVATGAMLYNVGAEFSTFKNAHADLKKAHEDQSIAWQNISSSQMQSFGKITNLQNDILQTYADASKTRLLTKGAVATGCAMGALAGYKAWTNSQYITQAAPSLMYGGAGLMIGGALLWAFNAGLESTSERVKRKGKELLNAIQNFEQDT